MSRREAASDDDDVEQYESDGKSYFTDSDDEPEPIAPRTAASEGSSDSDEPTTTAYPVASHPGTGVGPTQQASSESEDGSLESGDIVEEQVEVETKGTHQTRKPSEPYDVPTSGAFYMHDDRLGSDEEAPRRRPPRSKLYDSGPKKWAHDLFETLNRPREEDRYQGFLASRGNRRRDGSRGTNNAEPEGYIRPRRGRRGAPGHSGGSSSQDTRAAEEPDKPPGYEIPLGPAMYGNGRPRGGRGSRGGRGGRQGGGARGQGDRSQGGRSLQNPTMEKNGRSRGADAVPVKLEEWPALPSQGTNTNTNPAVPAATQDPGTQQNGTDGWDDEDIEYAPALPEAAIGDMDPFSVKPVARPLTIQAPDGDAAQSVRSRQSTRGRGRRFMSPPGRA